MDRITEVRNAGVIQVVIDHDQRKIVMRAGDEGGNDDPVMVTREILELQRDLDYSVFIDHEGKHVPHTFLTWMGVMREMLGLRMGVIEA